MGGGACVWWSFIETNAIQLFNMVSPKTSLLLTCCLDYHPYNYTPTSLNRLNSWSKNLFALSPVTDLSLHWVFCHQCAKSPIIICHRHYLNLSCNNWDSPPSYLLVKLFMVSSIRSIKAFSSFQETFPFILALVLKLTEYPYSRRWWFVLISSASQNQSS